MLGCRTATSLLCLVLLACTFRPSLAYCFLPAHERPPDAISLLDEAYELSCSFGTEERAMTLTDEAQAAARVSPERANRWSVEAFELSQQLPKGGNRAPIQKNALRALAVNDPDRALALYREQDLPAESAKPGEPMGEDPRSLGEGTVFQPVLRHWGYPYVQKLEDLANYLASTGQYPYAAMAEIASDIGAKHPSEARKIISDASAGFLRDPGFLSTNEQFVQFIVATHRVASAPQIRREIQEAVPAIEKPENVFSRAKWLITVTTPAGTTTFNSEREVLLYRLLPLLRTYLPREARKIATQYPSLRAAPVVNVDASIESAGAISMQGTSDNPRMRRVLDESRLFHARELARSNPQQALRMAEQITDPGLKPIALVVLAPYFSSTDADRARAWMQSGKQAFSKAVDGKLKLRLATALASAYLEEHDPGQAEGFIEQAFHLGVSLFTASTKTNPQQFPYMARGYDELVHLTEITCKLDPDEAGFLVGKTQQVPNPHLRAALLIAAAEGLGEQHEENE